jgi:hypothetical protein
VDWAAAQVDTASTTAIKELKRLTNVTNDGFVIFRIENSAGDSYQAAEVEELIG